jgi:hypothetical protein
MGRRPQTSAFRASLGLSYRVGPLSICLEHQPCHSKIPERFKIQPHGEVILCGWDASINLSFLGGKGKWVTSRTCLSNKCPRGEWGHSTAEFWTLSHHVGLSVRRQQSLTFFKKILIILPLFFSVIILLSYWGYTMPFTKFWTIYYSWIHPL